MSTSQTSLNEAHEALEALWLLNSAILVFFMQTGFAMLEAGAVQQKNIINIVMKNLLDTCLGALAYWVFGFGLAFGDPASSSSLLGTSNFALQDSDSSHFEWFFQFAFCVTASTIVSGAVAGRMRFEVYGIFAFVLSGLVQPVVAHWIWGKGFLYDHGVIDVAGGLAVHLVGGLSGLVATTLIGPRKGRFEGKRFNVVAHELPPYSAAFGTLGVLILWFGWYGFNAGSIHSILGREGVAALVVINTTLAPAGSILACVLANSRFKTITITTMLNSCLTGLVSITPACAVVTPPIAFLSGVIGALVYVFSSKLLVQLKIDDPLDASPVHCFGGIWGSLSVGLFAKPELVRAAFSDETHHHFGLFYGSHSGHLLLWQFIGVLCVGLWSASIAVVVIGLCKYFKRLRVTAEEESEGLDKTLHGGRISSADAIGAAIALVGAGRSEINNNFQFS